MEHLFQNLKFTRLGYNLRGQITNMWGDTTYPVQFGYDNLGQQVSMSTFRSGNEWANPLWPGLNITPDTTSWTYDPASGLVTAKTDAKGKSVTYNYSTDGKLLKRTWARGIETSYSHHPATGDLLSVVYSTEDTTNLAMIYSRLGQLLSVTDAAGQRTFGYNANFQQISETITGIYNKTKTFDYSTTGYKGRYQGMSLDNVTNHLYSYDEYGRLRQINNFVYSRLEGSEL